MNRTLAIGLAVGAGVGLGVTAGLIARRSRRDPTGQRELPVDEQDDMTAELPPDIVPPKPAGAPFAEGLARPLWPLRTRHPRAGEVSYRGVDGTVRGNWARRFAAPRSGSSGKRNHAGVDLYAFAGDEVLAMADGVVTAVQSFHLGSWAIFVDHGPVAIMYGEVERGSWGRLGLDVGSKVSAGQPIASVACMVRDAAGKCTSHMLHLEAYAPGTTRNQRWYVGKPAPAALRDPSLLLLLASQSGERVA